MEQIWILESTFANQVEAQAMARSFIQSRLVFCAQVSGPIESFYSWEGCLCEDQEFKLRLKFLERHKNTIEAQIKKRHSYQTPQILLFKVDGVDVDYYQWAEISSCK